MTAQLFVDVRKGDLLHRAGRQFVEGQGAELAIGDRLAVRAPRVVVDEDALDDGSRAPAVEEEQVGGLQLTDRLAPRQVRQPPVRAELRPPGAAGGNASARDRTPWTFAPTRRRGAAAL